MRIQYKDFYVMRTQSKIVCTIELFNMRIVNKIRHRITTFSK